MKYQSGDIIKIDPIVLRDVFERNEGRHSFEEETFHERSIYEDEDGNFWFIQACRSYSMGEWGYESVKIGEGIPLVVINTEGTIPAGIHPDIALAPEEQDELGGGYVMLYLWEDELDACLMER